MLTSAYANHRGANAAPSGTGRGFAAAAAAVGKAARKAARASRGRCQACAARFAREAREETSSWTPATRSNDHLPKYLAALSPRVARTSSSVRMHRYRQSAAQSHPVRRIASGNSGGGAPFSPTPFRAHDGTHGVGANVAPSCVADAHPVCPHSNSHRRYMAEKKRKSSPGSVGFAPAPDASRTSAAAAARKSHATGTRRRPIATRSRARASAAGEGIARFRRSEFCGHLDALPFETSESTTTGPWRLLRRTETI